MKIDYYQRQKLNDNPTSMQDLKYEWFNIYRSKPDWETYEYRSAFGTKKTRPLSRLNLPKTITQAINSLIFSENPQFNCNEYVQSVLDDNDFIKNLKSWYEYLNALGGGALKIYVKDGKIIIDFVKTQNFVPVSWNNQRITEADFYSNVTFEKETYTLVESHRISENGYKIITKAFNSSDDNVNLSDIGLTDVEETVEFKVNHPLFVYCPSIVTNNLNSESPESISLFANSKSILQECDKSYDALNSEVRLGKKRLIVGSGAVQKVLDEDGKYISFVDENDEIFSAINSEDVERLQVMDNSAGALRITDLVNALNANLKMLSLNIGFDVNFLSFDINTGLKTATEIISDNSATFRTISSMKRSLEKSITDLMNIIMIYKGSIDGLTFKDEEFSVKFEDNVIEDRNSKANYWHSRLLNKTTTVTDVLMKLDGLTREEAIKKAEEIKSENKTDPVPNLFE